jgi:hypothetical protein
MLLLLLLLFSLLRIAKNGDDSTRWSAHNTHYKQQRDGKGSHARLTAGRRTVMVIRCRHRA